MTQVDTAADQRFSRKERDHLAALRTRLAYISGHQPGRSNAADYVAGETHALVWALAVIEGTIEPVERRIEKLEHRMRQMDSVVGRLVSEWEAVDE